MKMSDVFKLPVHTVAMAICDDQVKEECNDGVTPWDCIDNAVNNHDRLSDENDRLKNALKYILEIVNDSNGVDGYHLNGDVADWDEFVEIRNANQLISELEGDK